MVDKDAEVAAGKVAGCLLMLLLLPLSALWRGYVLSILWGWFVVPLGVPPVTIPSAIGMALLIAMLQGNHSVPEKKKEFWELVGGTILTAILSPLTFLAMAWIIHKFI